MKLMRILISGLVLVAAMIAQAQITEPGWFAASRELASTNLTTLYYPGGAGGVNGGPSGTSSIAEAITPEIQALARGLENDPLRIFNYVHDHIRHVFYFGSKKGAQLALLERSGNDFDQSALLVALLRAAGFTNVGYQFGMMQIPYDRTDHQDLHHWLGLNLVDTDWSTTHAYLSDLLSGRGYPFYHYFDDHTFALHRVWVTLVIGGMTNYLDPAFKVSEPTNGIDLATAMKLDTTNLLTVAAGTSNSNYVQNVSETAIQNKLRDYTTNLLGYIQSNYPNASVEQILPTQLIVPATNGLSQTLLFPTYDYGGILPVVSWDNEPTDLMTTLTVSLLGTNHQWFMPELQGQRLSLTFNSNGLAQLWLDDSNLFQVPVTTFATEINLNINHPHGGWTSLNTLNNTGANDQAVSVNYVSTNATYTLLYAFEAGPELLRRRQEQLDVYVQQGLPNTSREVVSETLNVMGLKWLLQSELTERLLGRQNHMLTQYHHRLGRMAQESGNGYYIDVYMQIAGLFTDDDLHYSGNDQMLDLSEYFGSALEHGIIEQMQSSNLVAVSTVKMLQLANASSKKIYLAASNNWTAGIKVRTNLVNYTLSDWDGWIAAGYKLLIPQDGGLPAAGTGSFAFYGVVVNGSLGAYSDRRFLIGKFNGGYAPYPGVVVDTPYVFQSSFVQSKYFYVGPIAQPPTFSGDPVNMADGSFALSAKDISLGGAEPRGLSFTRSYSPTRRHHNIAGLANGWTHNYYFNLAELSAPEAGLGNSTPAQMAPMLVATCAAAKLYDPAGNAKNWLVTALITKWGVDQLINNAVSITLGNDTVQFIKQPNGAFTPPAGSTMSLLKTNSVYWLQQRHGNTFKFNTKNRLTNILDQSGQGLSLTYATGAASNWVATATDWQGRTLTFTYSGTPPRLTQVADNSSPSRAVTFGYSTNGDGNLDLISVSDPESQTSTLQYDTNHLVIATRDALGQLVVSNLFDAFGRVTTQYTQGDPNKLWQIYWAGWQTVSRDPAGGKQRYFYDDKVRLIAEQDALGNTRQTFFDGQDHSVMTISPLNETNQFIYDGYHNLIQTIDPLNFTNKLIYDSLFNLVQTVDARGNTNKFGYDTKFHLTGSTNGARDWTTYVYNTDGTLTNRTDAGGTTGYGYDANGVLSTITYPGGLGSESFVNNNAGDPTSHTDARGLVTSFQYNSRRQLTNTATTNLTTSTSYDAVGNVQSTKDARGFTTVNTWSPTRHLLSTTLPATPQGTPTVTNVYDSRDWLIRTIANPLSTIAATTSYTNDAAQRLIGVTDPLGRTARFGFDFDGRKVAATNCLQEVTRQQWNARGEGTATTDNAGHTVQHVFDKAGNQIFLTNRNSKTWQFQFDAANRMTNTVTPMGRTNTLTFDNRGLVKTMREPSGQMTTNNYDARGRLTNRVDAVASALFRYDANNNLTNTVENGKTNTLTFDAYNRVQSYKDADGNLIQYRYDLNGNLTNLTYPGGKAVTYFYDSLNRLTNVTDWSGRKTAMSYDLANQMTSLTRPNGTQRILNYDLAGQTTNIIEKSVIGYPIAFFKLNWNSNSTVAWEFTAPLPHTNLPLNRTNEFDDDNRLKKFNGAWVTNDPDGNLTLGPLTNSTLVNYAYDARNRLLSAGGSSYAYDPVGNRTAVTNGATATKFVINPNAKLSQVLMRIKGTVTNYYIYGAGLLYEVTETATVTNTLTYHFDYRGSTIALTDGNGKVTDRIEYSAYATTTYRTGTNDTPFLFNGRYGVQADNNGLLYMRARYYNPYLCRFLNADPSGFSGGLNFYAYANGNPVSLIDPFGLGAIDKTLDAIGSGFRAVGSWVVANVPTQISFSGGGGNEPSAATLPLLIGFLIPELRVAEGTAIPRGFASAEQFSQASQELNTALAKSGITDASIGVRGSSVTGISFRTGQPFGPASDIDFFVESGQLTQGLKTSPNIPGFVYPDLIHSTYDPIAEWSEIWSGNLGRDISVGGFQPGTVPAGPVIRP